ncbi:MAG: pyridoxal phosphate-dependent aminotransferase [Clostridia bacterium]
MTKSVSRIAMNINPSTTLAIDALFKKMKADGIDVVGFGAGEPDFPTPDNIKQAAINAIVENKTRYSPVSGIPELRQAVCDRLYEDIGIEYDPSQVVVSSGAKHIIYTLLMCLLNNNDEVIIPTPYWVSYSEMVAQARGKCVFLDATEENSFKVTADQIAKVITSKTKVLFLNSPSNPTGMIYSRAEMQAIADLCVKHKIYVISDEIYYKLVYDNKEFVSIASCGEEIKKLAILIHGVSKTYCMTGFRIGYALCNEQIAQIMANYLSHSTSCSCTVSQYAALEALTGDQEQINVMLKEFEKRRDHMVERMNKIEGISCIKPEGAFYIMMNMTPYSGKTMYEKLIHDDNDFAKLFLEKGLVATVPCSGFGCKNYIRWSYATSMEEIDRGLDRLEEFIKNS